MNKPGSSRGEGHGSKVKGTSTEPRCGKELGGLPRLLTVDETFDRIEKKVEDLRRKAAALEELRRLLLAGQASERFDAEDLNWVETEGIPLASELECWESFRNQLAANRSVVIERLDPFQNGIRERYERIVELDKQTGVFDLFPELCGKFAAKQKALEAEIERQRSGGRFKWEDVEAAIGRRAAELAVSNEEPGKA